MAIERKNPLPPGTYWVDVFAKDEQSFNEWLGKHPESVTVLRSEQHAEADPPWNWMLFKASAPVPWEGPGFPTIAEGEQASTDTVQREDPPLPIDEQLHKAIDDTEDAVKAGLTIGGLLLGGLILYKLLS